MKKLTSEHRKIYARELITLNEMTKDEVRQHYPCSSRRGFGKVICLHG
mgnify:CR=1